MAEAVAGLLTALCNNERRKGMIALRILRNLAVLAILAVAVLASAARPVAAQLNGCFVSRFRCSAYTTACHICGVCGSSTRGCYITCYDNEFHRYCTNF